MENLFDRAKQVALDNVMLFVPAGGQMQGDEYKCLNPTRQDNKIGSFSINVKTGSWSDFADNEAQGNDAISLYAYLNRNELEIKARHKGYKNINGGVQTESAKEILTKYDSTYFPSLDDDFTQMPKKVSPEDRWEGFKYVDYKIKDIPELKTSWYEKNWGDVVEHWDFYKKDRFIMSIYRFMQGSKKSDRPFTLWQKGTELKFRSHGPEESFPLWNINAVLEDKENKEIIITEGQKAASRYKENKYIAVGFYGGVNSIPKTDWSTLTGRNCYYWADADSAGRKAISAIRLQAEKFDINLSIIFSPSGVKKGWDLADAVAEGRDLEEIIHPKTTEEYGFLDDGKQPYTILGVAGNDVIFYVHASHRIEKCASKNLTKNFLMVLADREYWGENFAKLDGGGIAWDCAMNYLMRKADDSKVFNMNCVRGVGVWHDAEDIIINTGEYLLINGEKKQLHERVGEFVYIKSEYIPYTKDNQLTISEASIVIDWLKGIRWNSKISPYALAGWVALAPFGGVLRWRSYVWTIGCSGSGKSTLIEKFLTPMIISEFGIRGDGLSTPAGVRQHLKNTSKPYVGDEMESDNPKYSESIDQILKMFRSSSSGTDGGSILMGSQSGDGESLSIQSMACFASIGAAIKHGADANRFTICELAKPSKNPIEKATRKKEWRKTEELAQTFTKDYARRFHARTYNNLDEVLKCIDVFKEEVSDILDSMRDGDQLGSLLAGAYMIKHDKSPTNLEARAWLDTLDLAEDCKSDDKSEEEQCLDEILASKIEVSNKYGHKYITVGEAIEYMEHIEEKEASVLDDDVPMITSRSLSSGLAAAGYRYKEKADGNRYLLVAKNHREVKKALKDTAWSTTYATMLKRLDNAEESQNPTSFGGVKTRCIEIKINNDVIF